MLSDLKHSRIATGIIVRTVVDSVDRIHRGRSTIAEMVVVCTNDDDLILEYGITSRNKTDDIHCMRVLMLRCIECMFRKVEGLQIGGRTRCASARLKSDTLELGRNIPRRLLRAWLASPPAFQ